MRQQPSWCRAVVQFKCSCGMTSDSRRLLRTFCSMRTRHPTDAICLHRSGWLGAHVRVRASLPPPEQAAPPALLPRLLTHMSLDVALPVKLKR